MRSLARIDGGLAVEAYQDYFRRSQPVIVTGVVTQWDAFRKWTPHYLRTALAGKRVPVGVAASKHFRLDPLRSELDYPRQTLPFEEYADYVEGVHGSDDRHYYLQRLPLQDYSAQLLADLPLLPFVERERLSSLNLWFGPHDSCTALHWDDYDNAVAQLSGRKRFSLFAPADAERLYPHSALSRAPHQSRVDIDCADEREFPEFQRAERIDCVLEAGELLLLPACWWHQVTSIGTSVSVNCWWKADVTSLMVPNVACMMRELSRAHVLTALRTALANVHGGDSFIGAARRALLVRSYWMSAMLALAAIEEYVISRGRQAALVHEHRIMDMNVAAIGRRLIDAGVFTRAGGERLERTVAAAHRLRETAFAGARAEDAESMLREADAVLAGELTRDVAAASAASAPASA